MAMELRASDFCSTMMHMERDPDQSAVTDLPFQVELAGRGFGKTAGSRGYRATDAVQDEMRQAELAEATKREAGKRRSRRAVIRNWGRRYEQQADTRLRKRPVAADVACPHLEVRWTRLPHPRYGNAQPYFRSHLAEVGEHKCVPGGVV